MIGRTLGHYTILEKIGEGGMGEVYRAHDTRLERDVAIKVLPSTILTDSTVRQRFRREALALSKLNHPNIATVHDFNTEGGVDFLVMEFIAGDTLAARLEGGPLTEKELVSVGGQIAAALDEAHERGIVHRDLKPGNVIVTPKRQVKVLDFGLARLFERPGEPDATAPATHSRAVAGTFPYMAPEQLRGERLDPRTDIFALGVVLYELATGMRPFREKTLPSLTDAILHSAPAAPSTLNSQIPPELDRIILKALEKDPENRYQTAREVSVDLRRTGTVSAVSAVPVAAAAARRTLLRKIGIPVGAVAVLALALFAASQSNWFRARWGGGRADAVNSVVALPSTTFVPEADRYLTEAIPNSLSAQLTSVPGLETKVPPSSLEYARVGGDLAKVGDVYGVTGFILSTVSADGDRLTLNVQLVRASNRRLLWSRDFTGTRASYSDLVRQAAGELRRALRPTAAPPGAGGPANSEAELLLRRGQFFSNQFTNRGRVEDFDQALGALERAWQLDPKLADAPAAIAQLYLAKGLTGAPPQEVVAEVDRWTALALKADPRSSRAWAALADAEGLRTPGNLRRQLECALRAATFGPQDAVAQNSLASPLLLQGSYRLSLTVTHRASEIDPLLLTAPLYEAISLIMLGNPEQASAHIEQVLQIEPEMPLALAVKHGLLLNQRRTDEASALAKKLEEMTRAGKLRPEWYEFQRDMGAFELALARKDLKDPSVEHAYRLARGEIPFPRWKSATQGVAAIFARYGFSDRALEVLVARDSHNIIEPYDYLEFNKAFEPLRSNPRFQQVVARSRAQFEEEVAILRDARARNELPEYLDKSLSELLRDLHLAP